MRAISDLLNKLILLFVIIIAGTFAYIQLTPVTVIELKSPIKIIMSGKFSKPGEIITYTYKYCKNVNQHGTIAVDFVNNVILPAGERPGQLKKGCGTLVRQVAVPEEAPTGTYRLHLYLTYDLNELRTVKYEFVSEPFNVVADK